MSVGSSPKADAGKPALALPDKPSIAVLPFQNLSGDRDDYFGDGIAEDIITALSRLRGLFVIARNSTFAYRDRTPDVRQVARDLGVRYVLEGSVRRAADRLRVTAQLIDGTTGAHVWAERYDRALADVFVVQDEITASVVASTEEQVYAAEHTLVQSRAPESLDAWGCVIRAMPYVWPWVTQDNETGADLLKRALELAPGYARANSLLAWVWAARAHLGLAEPTGTLATAVGMAQQAILLDPDDAWAHLAAGYVHMVSRRTRSAREELSEAIDRNPSFALAHMVLGSTFAYAGLVEDGLRHLELAMRLSPHDPSQGANLSTTGTCHFMAGRYADAVELQRRAVQLRPGFGTAWRSLAAAAGLAGDLDTGAAALANARRLQPNLTLDWVKQYHPIVQPQDRARYIEGLRRAGLS